jgi:uncharacterized protein (DUF2164 family)
MMRGKPAITLPDAASKQAVASIRRYAGEELEHELGELQGAMFLDYVLAEIGPTIYNQAIADARAFFEERAADLGAIRYHAEFPFWVKAAR